MPPINATVSRSLRSVLTKQHSEPLKHITRGIAETSKRPTAFERQHSKHGLLLPTEFLPDPPLSSSQLPRNPSIPATSNYTPFQTLLNSVTDILTTTPRPPLPYLHYILRSYASDSAHWSRFVHANPEKQYTRNLVCEVSGVFNLLLLVWTPGQKSPVHDHADAHCLMKVLKGEIRETRFATPQRPGEDGCLVQTSDQRFGLNKVSYMADQLGLHSISNPHPTDYAVSLHLYTPPNAALRGCHVYDAKNGERKHVMQNAYDSVGGQIS